MKYVNDNHFFRSIVDAKCYPGLFRANFNIQNRCTLVVLKCYQNTTACTRAAAGMLKTTSCCATPACIDL